MSGHVEIELRVEQLGLESQPEIGRWHKVQEKAQRLSRPDRSKGSVRIQERPQLMDFA